MRSGATLAELMVVVILVGVGASLAIPPLVRARDRIAVRGAADRYAALHETARQLAIARGRSVRLELDTTGPAVRLLVRDTSGGWDTAAVHGLGEAQLATTQPTVTFGSLGFALGLSNGRHVLSRGAFAETLTVSRTGRLRRF